ncbi:DUF4767 domain-containing protein [Lacticaseibacillus camelliae]|uniref:DUF4767 domain-containing protein n=1 Tax=Lacticaseibacillus camelliae DSM 22697 = JCM 13995 TaxID=1423730 RepID=A0A0R2F9H0_9LACO|nr:DUF4767 domain-containing protein [Lacticaseibacillus camelliae]KRN21501.1 hypothetical protein FC75_GL002306 [Lacticaseibacillus camelliae DSM 22697 = JCM 13995]
MNRSTPRHWGIFAAVLLSALIFTGCGQRAAKSDSAAPSKSAKVKSSTKEHVKVKSSRPTSSSSKASSSSSTAASAASSQPATPWDSSKDAALTSFVNAWAKTMGQSYAKYDGVHPLKTSVGTTYPTDFSQELVNNTPNLLAWHPDGTGSSSYNVVAIYNYDGTEPPLPSRITYFFTFHEGQPFVLVDQSRDGAPTAGETQNASLRSNFQRIAEGKPAQ